MPTVGFHASHELESLIKERAAAKKLRVSTYLTPLVERIMRGGADWNVLSPTVLVELTREACGKPSAQEMEKLLGDKDQPKELAKILEGYIAARKLGKVTPEVRARYDLLIKEMTILAQQILHHPSPPGEPQGLPGSPKS